MTPLAAIHVAKKQLCLDDDTYRAVLVRVTGKDSSKNMTPAEQSAVLKHLRGRGFKPAAKGVRKGLEGRFVKKLQALWIAGWNLGLVENRRDEALLSFVKRQTGIDHVRFLRDQEDGKKAIEALKAWLKRDAGIIWGNSNGYDFLTHEPGKIAWAQFQKLVPGATLIGNHRMFHDEIVRILGTGPILAGLGSVKPADWRVVMNALGERIRRGR